MRIISKTHDYYDGVMKQAMDRTVIFNRDMKDNLPVSWAKTMGVLRGVGERETGSYTDFAIEPMLVFFCGMVVPLMNVRLWFPEQGCVSNLHESYIYNMDEIPAKVSDNARPFIEAWLTRRVCDAWTVFEYSPRVVHARRKYIGTPIGSKKWRKPEFVANEAALTEYALKNGVAYFIVQIDHARHTGNIVTHYPVLKDIEFFRVVTPFDAFQKIQMYLTNELAREKQMPMKPISDKLKAESHGYNEWSFRKEPTKARSKR